MLFQTLRNFQNNTIGRRLSILVAVCVLPIGVITGLIVYEAYLQKRALIEQSMQQAAQAVILSVDSDLGDIRSALRVLATSNFLDTHDLAHFHEQANEVSVLFPDSNIILADQENQQLINTYRAFGDPLPKRGNAEQSSHIFTTGQPVVSNMFRGALTKRALVAIDVPVTEGDKVVYDLSMTQPTSRLAAGLTRHKLPSQWVVTLLDASLTIIGHSQDTPRYEGSRIQPDVATAIGLTPSDTLETVNLNGDRVIASYVHSPENNWTAVVEVPVTEVTNQLRHWLLLALGGATLLLLAGGLLALHMASGIAISIRRLVIPALALGRGEEVTVGSLGLRETDAVGQALTDAARVLAERERERDQAARALVEQTRTLQHQYESLRLLNNIAALSRSTADERLREALRVGLHHLGLDVAIISGIDGDKYTVLHHIAPPAAGLSDGVSFELGNTYCAMTVAAMDVVAIAHMGASPYAGHPCYQYFRLERYIGAPLVVNGALYGTVNFSASAPQNHDFDEGDLEFVRLLARWIGGVIDQDQVYQQLARSNAELEQFAYVASHDLREPLRQVATYVTLLERHLAEKLDGKLDDDARDFIAVVRRGAIRMDRLIRDLMDYAGIGRHQRPATPVSLCLAVARAIEALHPQIEASKAQITVADPLPEVIGDQLELTQVFQNLIGNAIKYRAPDRRPQVAVSAEREGQEWIVTVTDNGIGIEPAHYDRIFHIFQRLHNQHEYEGTGIGLAGVKKIVERMGGSIWVESRPGEGSRFRFTLTAPLSRG